MANEPFLSFVGANPENLKDKTDADFFRPDI